MAAAGGGDPAASLPGSSVSVFSVPVVVVVVVVFVVLVVVFHVIDRGRGRGHC